MTHLDIINFIKENGNNGVLEINEKVIEQVDVRDAMATEPVLEDHIFQYTAIILRKEDITKQLAEAKEYVATYEDLEKTV